MSASILGTFHIVQHPIAQLCLAKLRDVSTSSEDFRRAMQRLGGILFIQASAS